MKNKRDDFKFDICDEFDCSTEYILRTLGYECNGEFWNENCLFYGEHRELNVKDGSSEK